MIGQAFGDLIVTEAARSRANRGAFWLCKCVCGAIVDVAGCSLRSGHTKSCGCRNRRLSSERFTTHSSSRTPEYGVWCWMKQRCCNQRATHYDRYGGRGITVCERWRMPHHGFSNFLKDMGPRPTSKHTIERFDNEGNYEPTNCHWVTRQRQANNTSKTVFITHNGVTCSLHDWARSLGLSPRTLRSRFVTLGWSAEKSLTTPIRYRSPNK